MRHVNKRFFGEWWVMRCTVKWTYLVERHLTWSYLRSCIRMSSLFCHVKHEAHSSLHLLEFGTTCIVIFVNKSKCMGDTVAQRHLQVVGVGSSVLIVCDFCVLPMLNSQVICEFFISRLRMYFYAKIVVLNLCSRHQKIIQIWLCWCTPSCDLDWFHNIANTESRSSRVIAHMFQLILNLKAEALGWRDYLQNKH